jgi:hypothetical protein
MVAGVGLLSGRAAFGQSFAELRYLFYSEGEGRTQVQNPTFLLHHELSEALGQIDLLLSHDSVSGASPTGAYPTLSVTTTTSASGITRVNPEGKIPMVPFSDRRRSEGFSWSRRVGAHLPTLDISNSVEKDYASKSVGISDAWTMAEGRGTLHYGLSRSNDEVFPVTNTLRLSKRTQTYALGWTWVMGADDLIDVSATHMALSGYLDEPYLVVPVGNGLAADHRPDTRTRQAFLVKQAHRFEWDGALKTSYRYYRDDWGLKAHTLDFTYDQRLDDGWIITPRLRYYTQGQADFYGAQFSAAQRYLSADYRLAAFSSVLGGLTVSVDLSPTLTLQVGSTYQVQQGKHPITPLKTAATSLTPAVYAGPQTSAADLNTTTATVGLKWKY